MKQFDASEGKKPDDGDRCKVKVFDPETGKTKTLKELAIFDGRRGVFFYDPGPNAGKRDTYKANRVRNVTEFEVKDAGYDPAPDSLSVIDHAATQVADADAKAAAQE